MTETPGTMQETEDRPPTVPLYRVTLRGFESEEAAHRFAGILREYVSAISKYLDLERLDGITVAYDYETALAELDRGYETSHRLSPTSEFGRGVAMTPPVIRDGIIKSHIVFDANMVRLIEQQDHELWPDILYTIAHECAHVHDLKFRDEVLPGIILQKRHTDVGEAFFWQIADGCWDEYAASRLSAPFGERQAAKYAETFVTVLKEVRARANSRIREYRIHGNVDRVFEEVTREYAQLMKFASYLIGDLSGRDEGMEAVPDAKAALDGHWFEPYFWRMVDAFDDLWERYGQWESLSEFEMVGNIGRDVIADGGLLTTYRSSGELYIDIPFTPETIQH
jgi:hypothetical protein